jgi:alkaline phosphatase
MLLESFTGFARMSGVFLLLLMTLAECGRVDWSIEKSAQFWRQQAQSSIKAALSRRENTKTAKNVIMFLGDGMGVTTVTAGRIRKGQLRGQLGEDFLTEMEQFDHLGLAKT